MSIYFYIFFYKKSWSSINDKLYPSGSALACIYGTPKMHKFSSSDSFPKPRLILSSIGTSNYNLARFLCNILSPLVPNDYSCNDTFYFVSQIRNANLSKIFLVSYDITCLLTNIPLPNFLNNRQRNIKFTVEKKNYLFHRFSWCICFRYQYPKPHISSISQIDLYMTSLKL